MCLVLFCLILVLSFLLQVQFVQDFSFLSGGIWEGMHCLEFIKSIVGGILSVCRCYQEKVEFKGQDFDLLPGQQRRTWNSCRNRRFSFRRVGKWDFVCMPLLPEKSRFQGSRN
ncbi:uncharacterized protein LOC120451119 isoform X2 [Drosophila santomea]|uniref:uncharacterized protein LOC120446191 isoform X2 n=1 Tax=Drosophila santomea TaxID=129105 RepID=UPI001954C4AA|nr:uncharacterized protein LOC120446191 isoform X2 [Drosophila santomea]XP_039483499.1 uncharacterized protein LOC120446548 isoform X2 [Drosophila santomea]XP_039490471.1 uncharacterized protein LOC120451119 isoform X2 [Drosophila santomea]